MPLPLPHNTHRAALEAREQALAHLFALQDELAAKQHTLAQAQRVRGLRSCGVGCGQVHSCSMHLKQADLLRCVERLGPSVQLHLIYAHAYHPFRTPCFSCAVRRACR